MAEKCTVYSVYVCTTFDFVKVCEKVVAPRETENGCPESLEEIKPGTDHGASIPVIVSAFLAGGLYEIAKLVECLKACFCYLARETLENAYNARYRGKYNHSCELRS